MHSHHSHSGEYISHASGSLQSMVDTAISQHFTHYCLTEHMPRLSDDFLYPEEQEKQYTQKDLDTDFGSFLLHARKLQKQYNNQPDGTMRILVGFEVEGIDEAHIQAAKQHQKVTDMSVGSVHYVHGIPIDFSRELWVKAREACAEKTSRCLYNEYFDLQYKVLTGLKPDVVGHFDLIRLFDTDGDEIDPTTGKRRADVDVARDWPDVWQAIKRNIEYVVSYGGLFELNSAAMRKGWVSPYPQLDISRTIKDLGGRFCLSDDAHTPAQVGLNYDRMWHHIENELALSHVYHLELDASGNTIVVEDSVDELSKLQFWSQFPR